MNINKLRCTILYAAFTIILLNGKLLAQVDQPTVESDTIYMIEERVVFDTLHLYVAPSSNAKTSENADGDLGTGDIDRRGGRFYEIGEQSMRRLHSADLKEMLPPVAYNDYLQGRRKLNASIPFWVLCGGGLAITGVGLYQCLSTFVVLAKYSDDLLYDDILTQAIYVNYANGFTLTGIGVALFAACLAPAIVLTVRGSRTLSQIGPTYNKYRVKPGNTAMRLSFGCIGNGVGLALSF